MDAKIVHGHFEKFFTANDIPEIVSNFYQVELALGIEDRRRTYHILKRNIRTNGFVSLTKLIEEKLKNNIYYHGNDHSNLNVVIIGAGPCGLRAAVECLLLGFNVVIYENRKGLSRNNVLHLWPFVIEDLKKLGAKIFFPKFCTGSMNHISIRRLQSILMKICMVLGANFKFGKSFENIAEPSFDKPFFSVTVTEDGSNSIEDEGYPVHCVIGAQGKRVTLQGFPRKEFRGKLAIAITANFANGNTTAEAVVEEISGVAYVYKQDFFNALYEDLGIALENFVYYKDETHYFVMTTKKHSLLDRHVLKKDHKDPKMLLHPSNVNKAELLTYIKDTCDYCTDYQFPNLSFAINHKNEPDVALFDFTSMFASRNSVYVKERKGCQLLNFLIGDGLLEPFWPTGSGCARGFLSAFDAVWALNNWTSGDKTVLQVIAEREAIYKMLPQTTSENLHKDRTKYDFSPFTRYVNVNFGYMTVDKILNFYDSDADNGYKAPEFPRVAFYDRRSEDKRSVIASMEAELARRPAKIKNQSSLSLYDESAGFGARVKALTEVVPACQRPDVLEWEKKMAKAKKNKNQPKKFGDEARKFYEDALCGGFEEPNRSSSISAAESFVEEKRKLETAGRKQRMAEHQENIANFFEGKPKVAGLVEKKPKGPPAMIDIYEGGAPQRKEDDFLSTRTSRKQDAFKKDKSPMPKPKSQVVIDSELDMMLAKLEGDSNFNEMTENEQLTWLESLFYQSPTAFDTSSRLFSDQKMQKQNKKKPRILEEPKPPKKEEKPVLKPVKPKEPESPVSPGITSKPNGAMARAPSVDRSSAEGGITNMQGVNVNTNMIDIAQSFFSGGATKKTSKSSGPSSDRKKSPSNISMTSNNNSLQRKDSFGSLQRKDSYLQIPANNNSASSSSLNRYQRSVSDEESLNVGLQDSRLRRSYDSQPEFGAFRKSSSSRIPDDQLPSPQIDSPDSIGNETFASRFQLGRQRGGNRESTESGFGSGCEISGGLGGAASNSDSPVGGTGVTPPPPPPKRSFNKAGAIRLLSNATNILQKN